VASDGGIDVWDAYVNTVADGSSVTGMAGVTWYAMASTPQTNARDHAVVSAPVYTFHPRFGVTVIATNYDDMWDGSLIIDFTSDENAMPYSGESECWTGSSSSGVKVNNREVGNTNQVNVRTGHFPTGSGNWFTNRDRAQTETKRFYALSEPITISFPPGPGGTILILR